ncbi:MAG TPA: DUF3185 domain-containing protein [Terriglobia bacterium]|nr:DUF3185 domain-containing protein [Terriglobia bacterium]
MKATTLVGILLIILGVVGLAYPRINYTTREKVVDLGPIEATKETKKSIPLPPVLGGLSLAGGVILLVAAGKGR